MSSHGEQNSDSAYPDNIPALGIPSFPEIPDDLLDSSEEAPASKVLGATTKDLRIVGEGVAYRVTPETPSGVVIGKAVAMAPALGFFAQEEVGDNENTDAADGDEVGDEQSTNETIAETTPTPPTSGSDEVHTGLGGDDELPPDRPGRLTRDGEADDGREPEAHDDAGGIVTGENGGFLCFRQQFDGSQPEVSDDERIEVADRFLKYVADTLEGNPARFRPQYNPVTHKFDDGQAYSLQTRIDWRDVGIEFIHTDNEYPDSSLSITEYQGNTRAGEATHYAIGADRTVKRHDWTLPSAVEQELQSSQINPDAPMSPEEAVQILTDYVVTAEEHRANRLMETAFGLNDQPIGIEELKALCHILDRALAKHKNNPAKA